MARSDATLTTIPDVARQHRLDVNAVWRLRYLLRGRAVGYEQGRRHAALYHLDDVKQALSLGRGHVAPCRRYQPLPPSPDLFVCSCGRAWITSEARQAHEARGECRKERNGTQDEG